MRVVCCLLLLLASQSTLAEGFISRLLNHPVPGGVAVVPVFAVGRAQAVLHTIAQLKGAGEIPHSLPIFLDSPMAIHTTALFERHPGEHRLSAQEVRNMDHVATMLETPEQSVSTHSVRAVGGRVSVAVA